MERDNDIIRYINITKKWVPAFFRKIEGKVKGYITYDDLEMAVMEGIIKNYETIKKFEVENPNKIERYLYVVVGHTMGELIRKEAKHQNNRVKVNCGESDADNDEIEGKKFFVDNKNAENILDNKEENKILNEISTAGKLLTKLNKYCLYLSKTQYRNSKYLMSDLIGKVHAVMRKDRHIVELYNVFLKGIEKRRIYNNKIIGGKVNERKKIGYNRPKRLPIRANGAFE